MSLRRDMGCHNHLPTKVVTSTWTLSARMGKWSDLLFRSGALSNTWSVLAQLGWANYTLGTFETKQILPKIATPTIAIQSASVR